MGEDKNSIGILEKLALISDAILDTFNTKVIIGVELSNEQYRSLISNFREIDRHNNQFSIEISGVEFHFMKSEDV